MDRTNDGGLAKIFPRDLYRKEKSEVQPNPRRGLLPGEKTKGDQKSEKVKGKKANGVQPTVTTRPGEGAGGRQMVSSREGTLEANRDS